MDCCSMAVSGDGCTYFHVCIQREFHVYKAVWTSVGVKKLLIYFSLTAKLQKNHVGSN